MSVWSDSPDGFKSISTDVLGRKLELERTFRSVDLKLHL